MSPEFTAYVAEDEPLARESLLRMFDPFPRWRVIGSAGDGAQALHECLDAAPDLLITDIRMPRLDGLELVAGLRAEWPRLQTIFITAYDQHAVAAFRLAAVDYLLKPVTDAEFAAGLQRAETQLRRLRLDDRADADSGLDALLRNQRARLRQLVVRSVGRTDIVPLADVIAFRATGNYVEAITAGKRFLHRQTMKALIDLLDPDVFVQTHRTAIVAVARIRAIVRRDDGWEVLLDDGSRHPLSASRHPDVSRRLEGRV
jgi:two-component system LytT family response regulator